MKTKKLIIAALLGLVIPLMSMGQSVLGPGTTGTSVTTHGSPHEFASQSWNPYKDAGNGGEVCQPCHNPHGAQGSTTLGAPLWNHQLSSASYTMYQSLNTSAGNMGVTAPDGTSKLCLSCHDGTVALGAYGQQTSSILMGAFAPGADLGSDLSNDHPISVDYVLASTSGFNGSGKLASLQPTTYVYATAYDPVSGSYTPGTSKTVQGKLDANNKIQCTSCHGPHGNKVGYQLSMDNRGSLLCLVCHAK